MPNLRQFANSFILALLFFCLACQSKGQPSGVNTKPPTHQAWTELLQLYVDDKGFVDYKGFKNDKKRLENYLNTLSNNAPDPKRWSKPEQLAYWINAYNAYTVKLIVDNYPVESIQDLHPTLKVPGVNTVWHKKFFSIGGQQSSLDEIEHQILRKNFNEARIHFAINCASFSCPLLRNEAYTAEQLEQQLSEQTRLFINDPSRNKISPNELELSKIFSWFKGDFTKEGSLIDFLNTYSKTKIKQDADIDFMDYNWDLNEQ